jgi:hypothetical protein
MARRRKFTQADVMELAHDGSIARVWAGTEPLIRNMDTTHDNSAKRSGSSIIGQFSMHRNPRTGQTVYVGENGQYVRFA